MTAPCPRCNGTGWVYMVALHDQPCPLCNPDDRKPLPEATAQEPPASPKEAAS